MSSIAYESSDESLSFAEWVQNEYPEPPFSAYGASLVEAGVSGDTVLNTPAEQLEVEFRECGVPRFPARDIVIAAKTFFENQRRVREIPMAVFWDVARVPPPSALTGRDVIQRLRGSLSSYGPIDFINAYMDTHDRVEEGQRSDFQLCGVNLRLLGATRESTVESLSVDVMKFVLDKHPSSVSVCIISDPTSFEYLRSTLRRSNIVAVLITARSLTATAAVTQPPFMRWETDVLKLPAERATARSVPLTPASHKTSTARFGSALDITGSPLYVDPVPAQRSARLDGKPTTVVKPDTQHDALQTLLAASHDDVGFDPRRPQALQTLADAAATSSPYSGPVGLGSRANTIPFSDEGDEVVSQLILDGGEPVSATDRTDDELWTLRRIMERLRDEGNSTPLRSLVGIKLKEWNPTAFGTRERRKQVLDRACETFCEALPAPSVGFEKMRLRQNREGAASVDQWARVATAVTPTRTDATAIEAAQELQQRTGLYGKANATARSRPYALCFHKSIAPADARLPQEFAYVCVNADLYFILFANEERREQYIKTQIEPNEGLRWLHGKWFLWDLRQPRPVGK